MEWVNLLIAAIGAAIPVGLATLGAAWKLGAITASKIDELKTAVLELKGAHALERKSVEARLEMHEYRINSNQQLIEHKFNRLLNYINQVSNHLEKTTDFQRRDEF